MVHRGRYGRLILSLALGCALFPPIGSAAPDASRASIDVIVRDTRVPRITEVQADGIETSKVLISWTTDEPADSRVEFGQDTTYAEPAVVDSGLVRSHQMVLTGLQPGTTYHYRVLSRDAGGNVAESGDFTFTTLSEASYVQRVNVGGSSYIDSEGTEWSADQAYAPGTWGYVDGRTYRTRHGISNTSADVLYQTERYRPQAYRFTVPMDGRYRVVLHFAEIFVKGPGQRVFDVYVEGDRVLKDLDIYAEVGPYSALVRTFEVEVTDGVLDITFKKEIEEPKISAIEVTSIDDNIAARRTSRQRFVGLEKAVIPDRFSLSANYPNPFNGATQVELSLPEAGRVVVAIYNMMGREVARLHDGAWTAGRHLLRWDGTNPAGLEVSSGVYFLQVVFAGESGKSQVARTRLMLVR